MGVLACPRCGESVPDNESYAYNGWHEDCFNEVSVWPGLGAEAQRVQAGRGQQRRVIKKILPQ